MSTDMAPAGCVLGPATPSSKHSVPKVCWRASVEGQWLRESAAPRSGHMPLTLASSHSDCNAGDIRMCFN